MLNQGVSALYSCVDGGSGVGTCAGTVASGGNITTSPVGAKTFTVNAADNVGNASTHSVTYKVVYNFTGFLSPVSNPPVLNMLKAGGDISLKFGLGGNQGLSILVANEPSSQPIDCTSKAPIGGATPTNPLGSIGLTYQPMPNQYIYTWLTNKTWAGTCRQFNLTLNDGTQHVAYFRFTQ